MPAAARWFVDGNLTGLGHVLAAAHLSVTWIGDDGRQGRDDMDLWTLTQVVAAQWDRLEATRERRPGPFIAGFTRTTVTDVRT